MICCELGVNWNWSNLDDRMKCIRDTGVHWVKGQLFHPDQAPKFERIALCDAESVERFKRAALHAGLLSFFTPMREDLVQFCDSTHIKIRHKDKDNAPLIRLARKMADYVWISGENICCVPDYPSTFHDYQTAFALQRWDGISSHMPSIYDLQRLLEHWHPCPYIEAHIKFSESDPEAAWSLSCADFKRLVEWEQSK